MSTMPNTVSSFLSLRVVNFIYLLSLDKSNANSPNATHCNECVGLASSAKRKYESASSSSLPPDSAKIRKTLKLLEEIEEKSSGEEKTIIFSQFTSMLNLLQPFLLNAGIKFVRCKYFRFFFFT